MVWTGCPVCLDKLAKRANKAIPDEMEQKVNLVHPVRLVAATSPMDRPDRLACLVDPEIPVCPEMTATQDHRVRLDHPDRRADLGCPGCPALKAHQGKRARKAIPAFRVHPDRLADLDCLA